MENNFVITNIDLTQTLEARLDIDSLISKAQHGDKDAFTLLYQEYVRQIYRYIYVRTGGSAEQAEDLTQEVFIRALKNLSTYRLNGKPFASWLFRIAHNLIIDHYRKVKKGKKVFLNEATSTVTGEDVLAIVEQATQLSEVKKAIEKLPPQQREIISLRFISGLSVTETAKAIGKTEGTVKKLQNVALSKLRKMMTK